MGRACGLIGRWFVIEKNKRKYSLRKIEVARKEERFNGKAGGEEVNLGNEFRDTEMKNGE